MEKVFSVNYVFSFIIIVSVFGGGKFVAAVFELY